MDGFKKLDIGVAPVEEKNVDKTAQKPQRRKKWFAIVLVLLVVLGLFSFFGVVLPGQALYADFQTTIKSAQEASQAVKSQDIEQASEKFRQVEKDLAKVEESLGRMVWMKHIPFAGLYIADLEHIVKGAVAGVQAAEITADTVIPYADLLGLKGKSTFVSGSADQRIQTAVETLDKVTPKIGEIGDKVAIVGSELDQIDPNRYPEKLGSVVIRSRLKSVKDIFAQTAQLFVQAQPLLKRLPDILGTKGSRTYLVLFQNDAELRATGGFMTAYALFNIDKGKMKVLKADDIYKLDESKKTAPSPPKPILTYHVGVTKYQLRDSNLSPDYVVSMNEFESLVKSTGADLPTFDGIITVDTHVLASAIKILGEFNVYGRSFSAENDPRCDCPKAVYELEDYSTRPVAYVREDRKDIIGVLLYQIMQRALGVSPSQYWGKLFQTLLTEAREKHVLFYFHDEEAQKGIEAVGFAGRIVPFDGDYLHINNVNFAGAKSNIFVKHDVKQEIAIEANGTVKKTVTILYKNPSPASNCNLEAGQLCLNGILRNWVRVYVPQGAKLVEFTGSEVSPVVYDELGKTVFEGFLKVNPQGQSEVKITYTLATPFKKGEKYPLLIQKQPGTDGYSYSLFLNGREVEKFVLNEDKKLLINT
ncbi:DUF4012 domain-containing protein [Candidatus Gottesmanbacteria bacterium]|nr:DUF4012 domain-containing protein [Candidatus Gottesmanbacteria bacterium]